MFGKQETKAFLEEKKLPFEWVEHKAVFTIEEMEELGLESMDEIAKNLFLRDQKGKRHFLVGVKGEKQVNLKELGEKLGTKLSFASEERLVKYLGVQKGSVTPLGVLNDENCAVENYDKIRGESLESVRVFFDYMQYGFMDTEDGTGYKTYSKDDTWDNPTIVFMQEGYFTLLGWSLTRTEIADGQNPTIITSVEQLFAQNVKEINLYS